MIVPHKKGWDMMRPQNQKVRDCQTQNSKQGSSIFSQSILWSQKVVFRFLSSSFWETSPFGSFKCWNPKKKNHAPRPPVQVERTFFSRCPRIGRCKLWLRRWVLQHFWCQGSWFWYFVRMIMCVWSCKGSCDNVSNITNIVMYTTISNVLETWIWYKFDRFRRFTRDNSGNHHDSTPCLFQNMGLQWKRGQQGGLPTQDHESQGSVNLYWTHF